MKPNTCVIEGGGTNPVSWAPVLRSLNLFIVRWRVAFLTIAILGISLSIGYHHALNSMSSLNYPPVTNGPPEYCLTTPPVIPGKGDQFDYANMGFTFFKYGIIGKSNEEEFKIPYREFQNQEDYNRLDNDAKASLKIVLETANQATPARYTFRPWLYSILLGTSYKAFGYSFSVGRSLNVFLYGMAVVLMFTLARLMGNLTTGLIAGVLALAIGTLPGYLVPFLTEVLSVVVSCLALIAIRNAFKEKSTDSAKFFLLGCAIGLCVWTKQIYLLIFLSFIGPIAYYFYRNFNFQKGARHSLAAFCGAGLFVVPYLAWNVFVTGHVSLMLGTNGYSILPAGYTLEYLRGENPYGVRNHMLFDYSRRTGIVLDDDIARAIAGRTLFLEQISRPEVQQNLGALFFKKIGEILHADSLEWLVRLFAVVGLIFGGLNMTSVLFALVPIATVVIEGLFVPDGSRLMLPSWPAIVVLGSIGIQHSIRLVASRATHWLAAQR